MNIPIQNIYYLLCYAWDKLVEKEVVNVESINSTSLADLFARPAGLGRSWESVARR